MIKFQVSETDLAYFPDWDVGQWSLYMPGPNVYYFRETEAEIDELMQDLREANETMRTAK